MSKIVRIAHPAFVLTASIFSLAPLSPAFAQQAAEPAPSAAQELPAVEVVAKKAAPAKKKQATKQAPAKKAAPAQAAATEAAPTSPSPGAPGSGAGPVEDYAAKSSSTATKTDTPLKETPQSISVVGKEQMRDQGVQNLQEALRYMPGVIADGFGYDSRGDYSVVRGISQAYFLDGLRTTNGYYVNSAAIEPYGLERAEVLRGPSSMLYGQVPTGGFVNAISKVPQPIPHREVGVDYGSFDFKQVRTDMTGPLTQDGKWLYRFVGLARDADTQVDYVDNDRLLLAPSLTYQPTNDTSITLLGNFRKDQTGSSQQFLPQIGTLTPNVNGQRVNHSTFVGEPGDHYDTEQQSATLLFDHRFDEDLKLHNSTRYTTTDNEYRSTYAAILSPTRAIAINGLLSPIFGGPVLNPVNSPFLNASQTEVARAVTYQMTETHVFNSDTSLTGDFWTGPLAHRVTGGFDYTRYATDVNTAGTLIDNLLTTSTLGVPLQPVFDIYNPVYGQSGQLLSLAGGFVSADDIPLFARPHEVQSQAGLYVQDQIKLGRWSTVLGVRQDWITIEQAGSANEHESATTGRAALLYNFDSGLTPYVSYSRSFLPLPGNPVGQTIFDDFRTLKAASPTEGDQIEIGFKFQPHNAPYMINGAIYAMNDRNRVVQPDVLFQAVQGVDVNVRGFELEAIGKVTDGLKIAVAYTYLDATYEKYPEINPGFVGISDYMKGKPVDGISKHLASFWAIYTVPDGMFEGLSFGGGVRYVGSTESYGREILIPSQELYVKTPSYTLFDAMIAYETDDWRWQLTAQNLEDKFHVVSCTAYRGDCGIGQARTVITGFTYKF